MSELNDYETEEKKKFRITRGMVILAAIVLIIIVIIIIVIVNSINKNKPKYTSEDFKYLETRMEEEAPTYISQKQIELTSEEIKIDLKDLLVENGGFIDSDKVKAAKICEGYVIAVKVETESYKPYISCGDYYTTTGYISNDSSTTKKTTTKKKDTEKPTITLIGEKEVTVEKGSTYKDEGAKATDNIDGDITSKIKTSGKVDTSKTDTYKITYTVSDKAGNKAEAYRNVTVVSKSTTSKATTTTKKSSSGGGTKTTTKKPITTTKKVTTPPTITLKGSSYITLNVGDRYSDPGYSATDALGNDITSRVNVSGSVNTGVAGTCTIRYYVTDSYGNSASKTRTVKVNSTYIKLQSITLTPNSTTLKVGQKVTLTVGFSPSNATNKQLTWISSNPSVATVSNGVVTGKSSGVVTITVKGADGVSATASIVVTTK